MFLTFTNLVFYSTKKEFKSVNQSAPHIICFSYDRECESAIGRLFKMYKQEILLLTWMVGFDNVSHSNFVHIAFLRGVVNNECNS